MNIRGGFDSRIVLYKKTLVVTVNTVLQGLFLRYSLINKVYRFYNILCKTDFKFVHELYTKMAENEMRDFTRIMYLCNISWTIHVQSELEIFRNLLPGIITIHRMTVYPLHHRIS